MVVEYGAGGVRRGFHTTPVDDGAFNYGEKLDVECSQKNPRAYWIRPQGGVVNQRGPFTFALEPQVDRYLQLDKTCLEVKMRVTKRDHTKLSFFKDVVAPVNLLGLTLWDQVEVELNGQRFSGSSSVGAAYKAWFETLLSFDNEARVSLLNSSLMYMDSPGLFGNMQVPKSELKLACRAAIQAGELRGPTYPDSLKLDAAGKNKRICPMVLPGEERDARYPLDSAAVSDGRGVGALAGAARELELENEAVELADQMERDLLAAVDDEDPEDGADEEGEADVTMVSVADDGQGGGADAAAASTSKGKGGGKGASAKGASAKAGQKRKSALSEAEQKCVTTGELVKRRRVLLDKYIDAKTVNVPYLLRAQGPFNKGFAERFAVCSGSAVFDTFSPVTHDVFRMNNHLGPGNRLTLILHPNKDSFLLNTYLRDRGFRLQILDLKLHLRTIERRERIAPPLREIYFLTETQLHKQIIAAGSPNVTFRMHQGGVMPKQIIVGFVTCKAAEGNYEYNPFNFHHFGCNHVELQINGEQYPSGGLHAEFDGPNAICARIYRWNFENTGAAASGKGNLLPLSHFQAGSFFVVFDLTADQCNQLHQHQAEYGFIDFHAKFHKPLVQPIYAVFEMGFPKVLVNDKRNSEVAVLDVEA